MNRVILSGRLTKDNELKFSSSNGTAYLFNTLAVEEYNAKEKKKVTEFFNIVLFGKNAENLAKYTKKGGRIAIEGSLRNNKYEVDGKSRTSTDIVVQSLEIIDFIKADDIQLVGEMPEVFNDGDC